VTIRFLLDTNSVSDLVRHPRGRIADRIERVGEQQVCTSIIVAAELRYGAAKKGCERLTRQLEIVLSAVDVLALEAPTDAVYGELRARLERTGRSIGGNDLLVAAHALALGHTIVTDNEREFARIDDLRVENWLR
jgi:tRNA(fMet)-specific endonuclease VapC